MVAEVGIPAHKRLGTRAAAFDDEGARRVRRGPAGLLTRLTAGGKVAGSVAGCTNTCTPGCSAASRSPSCRAMWKKRHSSKP
eukprot:CAMPEP_0177652360 /NCGR_PEP_ID=MMETSP0447-20121125/13079_1 /TAXON_ID=0 /ORGANISM="Stygamoeba regulata, Strain BSH-02190019" /LENGTH=81 /DNA_ID=CAMNT_0019155581 /DNA_START=513 /DNA_END=758 /DNA_ORIENTATION=+